MAGRMVITERDLATMLSIVGHPDNADEADLMPYSILAGLHQLIPCDNVSFIRYDSHQQEFDFNQEVGNQSSGTDQEEAANAAFWTHYWDSPPCSYPDTSGDLVTVTGISDFLSDRQLHRTPMYNECLRPLGVERELMLCLPSRPGRALRLLFFREAGSDFSPRDRGLLALLRPHLDRAYRAQRRRRSGKPELTARQWQLLRLVAAGYTNGQIGRRMSISEATVRKHLEHVFQRLQVTSRTAAVTRAFGDEQQ